MSSFAPKEYQDRVLESVRRYFEACNTLGNANTAFYQLTGELWGRHQPFNPLPGFTPDMPYFCLRVPTGGGKTFLAARSVALVNTYLLRSEHSVVLWLVPSDAIREQTLKALRQLDHPYHQALKQAGAVTVIDLDEAKSITRATLDTSTVVIVSTVQAFRRDKTDGLKVYQSSGALMQHFDGLASAQRENLLRDDDGTIPCSLANVLRLRRPFLIVDEAHNARTEISFTTFERFNPSGVMELTATPDTEKVPSNVLHSVGAAELKTAQMIKLPVLLEAEPDWQQCLADAIARRNELQTLADDEHRNGAPYLRPLVLIQAEPRRQGVETLDTERVKKELVENQRIPADEIAIATGEERGLDDIERKYRLGISDPDCPVKFVITQRALAEGWDCPFAYILVGLSSQQSGTAVEQLIGRVLRQPDAKARTTPALNQSYAFVRSSDFARVANELRDGLVRGAGFERKDVSQFVAAQNPDQSRMDFGGRAKLVFTPVAVALPKKPVIPDGLKDKLEWDKGSKTLTINAPLSETEAEEMAQAVTDTAVRAAIVQAAEACRTTAIEPFQTPAETGERLRVPQLALYQQGELQLFDDAEVLDYPWALSDYQAAPTPDDLSALGLASRVAGGGTIDVTSEGRVEVGFLPDLQRDLGLSYTPEHWDETRLAAWLCRNLLEPSLTHASKQAFVSTWLHKLLEAEGFTLARANQLKFTLRKLLDENIRRLRRDAVNRAYEQALFGEGRETRVAVGDGFLFEFDPQGYAPSRDYDPRKSEYGAWDFRKHFHGRIGDFDSREEFDCAVQLDMLAQAGRMKFWVRNLVNRGGGSFFLQKASGRFYPDFVCALNDGTILVVEYKGAHGWNNAEDDRQIGDLWAELSGGRCRFVMVRNRQWGQIEACLD
ncbi:DEAD/DEAH box helicase [Thermomonas sp.]|uniref:DEAD/DEAH box helicase n=1 Tax=Thermomonas sp. TaxID=1971895 RepID=UPI0035AED727